MRCIRAGCGKTTVNPTGICYACEGILKIDEEMQKTRIGKRKEERSALSVEREQLNKNKEVGMAGKNKVCPDCNMVQPSNRQEICDCGHEFKKKAGKTLKGYHKTCSGELCEKYAVKDGLCCKHYKAEHGVSPYGKAKGPSKKKSKKVSSAGKPDKVIVPFNASALHALDVPKNNGEILNILYTRKSEHEQEILAIDTTIETIKKYV